MSSIPDTPHDAPGKDSWWRRLTAKPDGGFTPTQLPTAGSALLDCAADSLQRCGFPADGFQLELIGARDGSPTLIVGIDTTTPAVWSFSRHLEVYLIDRIHRHTGLVLGRIAFTPRQTESMSLAQARIGVRAVWSSLTQARQPRGDTSPLELTGP